MNNNGLREYYETFKLLLIIRQLLFDFFKAFTAQLTKVPSNVSWPFKKKIQTGFRAIFKLLPKKHA